MLPDDEPSTRTATAAPEGDEQPASTAQATDRWRVGDVLLDLYEVTGTLGEGGMGTVYRVYHRGWGFELAVKTLRPELARRPGARERFIQEAMTWMRLGLHPHIVTCFYARMLEGIPRVFAEYVEGGALAAWIRSGRLYRDAADRGIERILDVSLQMALGLHHAHTQGMIHQDVKPDNVLVTPTGTVKVTDFGLAGANGDFEEGPAEAPARSITATYRGRTPGYCSPEQLEAADQHAAGISPDRQVRLTRRTDIWSWAVSVLEMFMGRPPCARGHIARSALEDYLAKGPPAPHLPPMPDGVSALLRHCLERRPEDRPGSLKVVAARMREIYRAVTGRPYARPDSSVVEAGADGLNNQAISLIDLGRSAQAEALLERCIAIDPHHVQATYNRGLLGWRSGRQTYHAVVRQLGDIREASPRSWEAPYLLGWLHAEMGEQALALMALNEASRLIDGDADKRRLLARARSEMRPGYHCLCRLTTAGDTRTAAHLTADGRFLLSSSSGALSMWEIPGDRPPGEALEPRLRWAVQVPARDEAAATTMPRPLLGLSADGAVLLSPLPEGGFAVRAGADGRVVRQLRGPGPRVSSRLTALALSGDGRHAAAGYETGAIHLWSALDGRYEGTLSGHTGSVHALCITPDGATLLSGGFDGTVRTWALERHAPGVCLQAHMSGVEAAAISADGRHALSSGRDQSVKLWDLKTGSCTRRLEGSGGRCLAVALTNGRRLAFSADEQGLIQVWHLETGRCLRELAGSRGAVHQVSVSAEGEVITSAGLDGIRLWRLLPTPTAPTMVARPRHTDEVADHRERFSALLSEARSAAAREDWAGALSRLREARSLPDFERAPEGTALWGEIAQHTGRGELRGAWPLEALALTGCAVNGVALSPDGRVLISGGADGRLSMWDVPRRRAVTCISAHRDGVTTVQIGPNGCMAVSAGADEQTRFWHLPGLEPASVLSNHAADAGEAVRSLGVDFSAVEVSPERFRELLRQARRNPVAVTPEGRLVLTAGLDLMVRVRDAASDALVRELAGHTGGIGAMAVTPDGLVAISASSDATLRVWDLVGGRCTGILSGHRDAVDAVAISHDARLAISGSADATVKVWDIVQSRCLRTLEGHGRGVRALATTPDGRIAVSASADASLRLWDVARGVCLRSLEGHTRPVSCVAMTPDCRLVASGGEEGVVRLWQLDWELQACPRVPWYEGARPWLSVFLSCTTPVLPDGVSRGGAPSWTREELEGLLRQLRWAGYGWLEPTGVLSMLNDMVRHRTRSDPPL